MDAGDDGPTRVCYLKDMERPLVRGLRIVYEAVFAHCETVPIVALGSTVLATIEDAQDVRVADLAHTGSDRLPRE